MSHKVNLVRVLTAATGNSTPITLGAAYSQLFMTPAEAGAMNGRVYTYLIVDGNDWELGKGVYTSSGTTLARTTILASRISGTLGTSRISLSGTAQVRFVESAEDMDGVRGTRAVTGTSDVIANSDQGYAITYSNAASIAVTLAQASASNLFLDGWATTVQNLGAGTVTITPATSTINGASTLVLAQNMGAFIWSDGTNYHAAFMPVTKPLLAGNNLSDGTAATMLTNLGGTTVGKALFTAVDAAAARAATGAFGKVVIQKFTASGTYTPDAHLLYAIIECVGSGGGGGGAVGLANKIFSGAGGSSGGRSITVASAATIGASQTVTVGSAGSGGSGSNDGGTGGDVSVGTLCIAKGGLGGKYGSTAQVPVANVGAPAGTGDITDEGSPGLPGLYATALTIIFPSGGGGSSVRGGGAAGVNGSGSGTAGNDATGYGSGGSGGAVYNGTASATGGQGSKGVAIITEYCSQ